MNLISYVLISLERSWWFLGNETKDYVQTHRKVKTVVETLGTTVSS